MYIPLLKNQALFNSDKIPFLKELQEKMNLKYVWSDEKNKNGDVKGWTLEPLLNNKEH